MKSLFPIMCLLTALAIAMPANAAPLEVGPLPDSSVAAANSETFTANDRVLLTNRSTSPAATPGVVATSAEAAAAVNAGAINGQAMTINTINNKLDAADPGARDRGLLLVT